MRSPGRAGALPSGTVTFLFSDVEGSTRLWAADRQAMSASLAVHDAIVRGAIESAGGYVFSTGGDSFAAAFARASDAVAAAGRAQAELATVQWPGPALRVRMGLHLGEAEERDGDYFGPVVNTAARVEAAGHGGQVLLTEPVRVTAEVAALDLGVHALRDVNEPLHLYQLGDDRFPPLRVVEPSAPVRCRVLGPLTVDGQPLSSARQRRVLAALVMARGAVVSSDRLVDVVWDGDPPPTPLNALQTYTSRLRTILGTDAIAHRPPGYALALADDEVDAWRFETLVERVRPLPPADALAVLDEALGLWRGASYAEFADADFARGEAVRLEERRASAEGMRLDALLRLGRHDEVLVDSLRLTEADPYRESVWEQRMRALHAAGRTVDAIRTFQEYRTKLLDDVGLEPSADLAALERALVASPSPADTVTPRPDVVLPAPLTSFLGRHDEVREVAALLEGRRVVTLVGPGGVGKTRLAIEAARTQHHHSRAPTWFVELVAHGPDDVERAAARAIGVAADGDPLGGLRRRLGDGPSLVVIDNCEHVVDAAAALVDGLVPYCPELRVLATSRMPLGLAGEAIWTVPPLETDAGTRLFLDRATTAGVRIDDAAAAAQTVAAICAAVDRLPLGIELAAAAARSLPLDRVADGLRAQSSSPGTSAIGRHRTLDATVAWSYQLLPSDGQILLRRLAVFEGGWTLDTAEAVCVGDGLTTPALPPAMVGLEAASLVTLDRAAGRYSMLETIRAFARIRLDESGEADACRDAHLASCLELAAAAAPRLREATAGPVVRTLETEYPNLRAALRWALGDDRHATAAATLAHDLYDFWLTTDAGNEAVSYLRQVLALPGPLSTERVELRLGLSELLSLVGDLAAGADEGDAALASARTLGDRRLLARCLVNASFGGHLADRSDLALEARDIAEDLGDHDAAAAALHMLGLLANRAGRAGDAIVFYEQSLRSARTSLVYGTHCLLSQAYRSQGRWLDARRELLACEQDVADAGGRPGENCMELALIELCLGDVAAALRVAERAAVWGRPADDFPAAQVLFDAVNVLLEAERGDLATAAIEAATLAALPGDVSSHGNICLAWLVIGEVLVRAGDVVPARRCFTHILRHRNGAIPYHRAHALAATAATVAGDDATRLGAVATSIRDRYDLVTPPWLTCARFAPIDANTLTEDEAGALALSFDAPPA